MKRTEGFKRKGEGNMKRTIRRMFMLLIVLLCSVLVKSDVAFATTMESGTVTVGMTGQYYQTEARSVLSLVNEFRSGDETWYWNQDNTTKTTVTGLRSLVYDYALEEIAMQRAMEIALSYSHTRPNGEDFNTIVTSNGMVSMGENIAAATYHLTPERVMELWIEADELYSGQGHRRNMLETEWVAIGVAHVCYNGYHYYVQEFSTKTIGAAATKAVDTYVSQDVDVEVSKIGLVDIGAASRNVVTEFGKATQLPKISLNICVDNGWPTYAKPVELDMQWIMDESEYGTITNNVLRASKVGSTTIHTRFKNEILTIPVTIDKRSIVSADIALATNTYTYDGTKKYPAVKSVVLDGKTLVKGTDYNVSYVSNENAGEGQVVIQGRGNYGNSTIKRFTIKKCNISKTTISLSSTSFVFNGCSRKPTVTVKLGNKKLLQSGDYKLSYSNTVNAGTVKITITGIGNFTGSVTKTYTIKKASMSKATIVVARSAYYYTGNYNCPAVSVKLGNITLKNGTQYKVRYQNNKAIGQATVTIKGMGDMTGTVVRTFKIVPKRVTNFSQVLYKYTAATIMWDKVPGATGYQVFYSVNGGSYINLGHTTSNSYKKTGLNPNNKYYFCVRAYGISNGQVWYGPVSQRFLAVTQPAIPKVSLVASSYSVKAVWDKVPGAYGYEVYMAVGKNSGYKKIATVKNNYVVKSGLNRGQTYYISVRALSKNGKGQWIYSGLSKTQAVTTR